MLVRRVEKHIIKENNEYFNMLIEFCHKSKNLYNHANYIIRQEFISNNRWIRYKELNDILKNDKEFPDYDNMPLAQSAQQTLKLLDKNWKSFFKAILINADLNGAYQIMKKVVPIKWNRGCALQPFVVNIA